MPLVVTLTVRFFSFDSHFKILHGIIFHDFGITQIIIIMEKKIKLNSDEIYYILEYLKDDYSTLYNFLTVNKLFCSLAVHFLWSNPISKINKERIKIKIINIYLS